VVEHGVADYEEAYGGDALEELEESRRFRHDVISALH
jgi:hypothetical protein